MELWLYQWMNSGNIHVLWLPPDSIHVLFEYTKAVTLHCGKSGRCYGPRSCNWGDPSWVFQWYTAIINPSELYSVLRHALILPTMLSLCSEWHSYTVKNQQLESNYTGFKLHQHSCSKSVKGASHWLLWVLQARYWCNSDIEPKRKWCKINNGIEVQGIYVTTMPITCGTRMQSRTSLLHHGT